MSCSRSQNVGLRCATLLAVWFSATAGSVSAQQPATAPRQPGPNLTLRATPEDWSSLSLAGSQLHAATPLFGQRDQTADFVREFWRVQWRNYDPIDLYVIRPQHAANPPVILYLYSYPSETDRFRDNDYCRRLTEDGFAAIGFVSALTGHRYHAPRPPREWFVSELQESLGSSVHDVQMILNYLATRGDLDMSRVGMFGVGSGATVAILAAAADPRITTLDLLDPWGDWPDWLAKSGLVPDDQRAELLKPEFLKKVAGLDPVQWLPRLKTQNLRLQEVATDPVTPAICRQKLEAAAPPSAQPVNYDGVPALSKVSSSGQLFQWIKEQLRRRPEPQAVSKLKSVSQAAGFGNAAAVR
jgi:hypothetical protein